jgi:predicted kinase
MNKPKLLILLGYPGSGKSHFSERLSKKEKYVHISSDIVRYTLFKKPKFDANEHSIVFSCLDYFVEFFLQNGFSVIYDANTTKRIYRKRLCAMASKRNAEGYVVWLQTSVEVASKRLAQRASRKLRSDRHRKLYRAIPQEALHIIRKEQELPGRGERTVVIDGELSFSKQYEQFRKQT